MSANEYHMFFHVELAQEKMTSIIRRALYAQLRLYHVWVDRLVDRYDIWLGHELA